jgi:hypothetical protein
MGYMSTEPKAQYGLLHDNKAFLLIGVEKSVNHTAICLVDMQNTKWKHKRMALSGESHS